MEGGYIHGFAVKNGLFCEMKVLNSHINMYGNLWYLSTAFVLFEVTKFLNLVLRDSIIKICIQSGLLEKSILYSNSMKRASIYHVQATVVQIYQGCTDMDIEEVVDTFHCNILCSA